VADDAIMRDMRIGHDPVVVADLGDAPILQRAAVDGRVLAYRVAMADHEACRLARVFLVLRRIAYGGELKDVVVFADRRRPFDHGMRLDARAAADLDVVADDGKGTDARFRMN